MSTTTSPPPHEQITEPVYKVIAEFMEKSSDDPETRDATTTALAFSFWQMAARGMMPRLPAMILVYTGEKEDPVMQAVRLLCNYEKDEREDIRGKGSFGGGTPEQAPGAMLQAVCALRQFRENNPFSKPTSNWETYFHDARETGYGKGDIRPYAGAWDPKLGLVTDQMNSILLLLDEDADRNSFRHDLLHSPEKIQAPAGIGQGLNLTDKTIGLSGSLNEAQCDEVLVDAILELGHPVFFLPHSTEEKINIPNWPALSYFSHKLHHSANVTTESSPRLPQDKWCRYYQNWIWKRLGLLPANYRYSVVDTIHQLQSLCETLALFSGPADGEPTPEVRALARNLFTTCLRSVALSLAFLAWHGHGIELACSLKTARKVLRVLREDGGSMPLRDVQRATGFGTAAKRDKVLRQLEVEGLVVLDDKLVSATSMDEFIQDIRQQLPMDARV